MKNMKLKLTLTLPGPSAGVSVSLDSYCSLKPLCSGMGEVVPARTSPTLLPHPLALCCHYPVSKYCSASIVVTSTVRVKRWILNEARGAQTKEIQNILYKTGISPLYSTILGYNVNIAGMVALSDLVYQVYLAL